MATTPSMATLAWATVRGPMSEWRAAHASASPCTRRIALAGNPNVGKSSLFNQLTGARQHVANWPGKTVERRAGTCRLGHVEVEIVDLPGTYSLAGLSPEERVAAEALTDPGLAAVVVVLDTANLERNLYLAAQIAELGRPMLLALNMIDTAARDGLAIDDDALSRSFGAPVVRTVARTGGGLDALRRLLLEVTEPPRVHPTRSAARPSTRSPQGGGS